MWMARAARHTGLYLLSVFGTCAESELEEVEWSCGDLLGYQGYDYETVQIGEQCWFAENLLSESYANGDTIPGNLNSAWSYATWGATAVYEELAANLETYGRLYNWYAVDDARGLCPSGWHVPTDGELTVLSDVLGGASVAGGQMRTTYGWYVGGNGTNSSGFSGLPGGYRDDSVGGFINAGSNGFWWSSSPLGSDAWNRYLYYGGDFVIRNGNGSSPRDGFSVRCVRDAE